jgi:hypothetical protein
MVKTISMMMAEMVSIVAMAEAVRSCCSHFVVDGDGHGACLTVYNKTLETEFVYVSSSLNCAGKPRRAA